MTLSRVCFVIAIVIFVLAAIGAWPSSLADDVAAVPLGLAFLAAGHLS